ncbi:DNA-J related domain-containing protein [Thiomicrospira pelophila]|uniref:DNA-J related domain-containing protein n=1 Tax=Thiomicrospira pelophila TaxID=934 RepID=UPI0004A762C8|nr:DNA-J related domain-containing protein [Thiomicrospira pelophila]
MAELDNPQIDPQLETELLNMLRADPTGVAEHALLKQLSQAGYEVFTPSLEPLELFQAHFLLFHILYRLADKWQQAGHGRLVIDCLNIHFQTEPDDNSKESYQTNLAHDDSLKRYYLDYQHYRDTQTQDVIDLLDSFWRQQPETIDHNALKQAKITLELPLDQNLDRQQINHHYRRLSFSHHPDRGGDTSTFQKLSNAVQILRRAYPE